MSATSFVQTLLHLPPIPRFHFLHPIVFGSIVAFASMAMALEDENQTAEAEEQTNEEAPSDDKPVATQTDTVVVEAPLPLIPSSNTISTKLPVDIAWTPFNVGAVSAPIMKEQWARTLDDALENISGVNTQPGSGVFDYFVVRGFDSVSSGLVLTDGAPEPEATFYQLYNTERVEMLKGPGGFLYGPKPLAAAVNLVRKQPVLNNFGVLTGSAGSFGTYEGILDLNHASKSGEMAFRLNGLYRDTEGYRDNTEGAVGAFNPAFSWRPSGNTTVNVNFEYVDSDFNPDAGIPVIAIDRPEVDRKTSYASPFDFSDQTANRAQVDVEHRFSDRFSIRNKTYFRQLDWQTNGTLLGFVFPTGISPDDFVVTRSLLQLDDKQDFFGNQFESVMVAQTGSVRHRILAGIELSRFDDRFTLDVALLPPISVADPFETAMEPLTQIPGQSSAGNSQTQVMAPYVIDEIAFNSKFQILIGARYDSIDFDDDVSGTSRADAEVSPMIGAVFRPNEAVSLYANFSRAFAPPSPRIVGEQKPEESQEIEVGVRSELLDGKARITVALFELERENIGIPDDNGFTQQAGDQRARGVELEASTDLTTGLTGLISYAYTDSELTSFTESILISLTPPTFFTIDRSGNKSTFSPRNLAKVWLSQRFDSGLMIGGGVRYVGKQFIAEDNATELDDYSLLDLVAAYSLGDWRISLNLDNVTDKEYEARGFGGFSVIPGRPFSATFGLQYRF